MSLLEESPVVTNEAEADALISRINGNETPPPTQATDVVNKEKVTETAPQNLDPLHKIVWKGQEKELPLSKLIKLAQQSYDYNEKSAQIKTEQALIAQEKKKWADVQSRLDQYKQVEDYQKKDPNWWSHVLKSYQEAQGKDQGGQILQHPVVQELMNEVKGIKEDLTTQKEREKLLNQANEDVELDKSISDFKETNSQFDWNTLDESGHNLERRILQHGLDNQIRTFRASARDYLFDEITKRHEVKAKEQVAKQLQKQTKLGLGPIKDESSAKIKPVQNIRSKSWDEIGEEAKRELAN